MALSERDEEEIVRLAAALESQSEYPSAAGIVRVAEDRDIQYPTPKGFEVIPGKGAQGIVDGVSVKVVSPGYLKEKEISISTERKTGNGLESGTKTAFFPYVPDWSEFDRLRD